jgi:hypothetical protein
MTTTPIFRLLQAEGRWQMVNSDLSPTDLGKLVTICGCIC